jgi:hypothetical protein
MQQVLHFLLQDIVDFSTCCSSCFFIVVTNYQTVRLMQLFSVYNMCKTPFCPCKLLRKRASFLSVDCPVLPPLHLSL